MDKTVYYCTLYDYYGGLLTDNQREIFEDYYFENLTMQEIADNNEVSKNAIHKTIITITKKLETYEEILKYDAKVNKIKEVIKDKKILEEVLEIL